MYIDMSLIYILTGSIFGFTLLCFALSLYFAKKYAMGLIARYIISDYTEIKLNTEKIKAIEKQNKALTTKVEHLSQSHVTLTQYVERFIYQYEISQQNQQEKRLDKFLH